MVDVGNLAGLKDLTKCITDLSIPSCMFHGCPNILLASPPFLMMFEPHSAAMIGQRVSIGFLE